MSEKILNLIRERVEKCEMIARRFEWINGLPPYSIDYYPLIIKRIDEILNDIEEIGYEDAVKIIGYELENGTYVVECKCGNIMQYTVFNGFGRRKPFYAGGKTVVYKLRENTKIDTYPGFAEEGYV